MTAPKIGPIQIKFADVQSSSSLTDFRHRLKTYLFRESFPDILFWLSIYRLVRFRGLCNDTCCSSHVTNSSLLLLFLLFIIIIIIISISLRERMLKISFQFPLLQFPSFDNAETSSFWRHVIGRLNHTRTHGHTHTHTHLHKNAVKISRTLHGATQCATPTL